MAFKVGSIVSALVLKLDSWDSAMAKVKNDQKEFVNGTRKSNKSLEKMGDRLVKVGKKLTIVSVAFVAVATVAVKAANKINTEMAGVATLLDQPRGQIQGMKEDVQKLAIQYGKSTSDMSKGLFQVISAFGEGSDSLGILNVSARAATAGMSTTKEAIDLATIITKSYNVQTKEGVQHAMDLAFTTNKLGVTTFPELAASMGRVVPLAAQLGVSQEELFAGYSALTGVTGNTTEVSTQFSAILRAMIKPTEDMKVALEDLEFATVEDMIASLGFQGSLEALRGETDGTTAGFAKLFGRAEAIGAGLALTTTQADKFKKSLVANKKATGASDKALKNFTEGVGGSAMKFEQAKVAASVLTQQLGDNLAPALMSLFNIAKPFINVFSLLLKGFNKLPGPIKVVTVAIIAITVAIPPLMVAYGLWIKMVATTTPVYVTAGLAITKMMAVLGLALIAYQALTSALDAWGESYVKQMGQIVKANTKGQAAMKKFRDFQQQASPEMVENIKRVKREQIALGKSADLVAQEMIFMLSKTSTEYQNWEKKVTESIKKPVVASAEAVAEQIRLRTLDNMNLLTSLDDAAIFTEAAEAAKTESEIIINEERTLREEELLQQKMDREQRYNDFFAAIQIERIKLDKTGLDQHLALEEQRYLATKKKIDQSIMDESQKRMLLIDLEKNYIDTIDKMKEKADEKDKQRRQNSFNFWVNTAVKAVGTLTNLYQAFQNSKLQALDEELEERRQFIIDNVTDEEERARQLTELEEEIADRKAAATRKGAAVERASAIVGIIANTALAVAKSLPNIFQAAVVGALGAAQLATVLATPLPALAEGGIVTGEQQVTVGDNPSHVEAIVPLEKAEEMGFGSGGGGEGNTLNVTITGMDPRGLFEVFQEEIMPLIQESFNTEQLTVNPAAVRES